MNNKLKNLFDPADPAVVCFHFGGFYQGIHQVTIESAVDFEVDNFNQENGTDLASCDYEYNYTSTISNYLKALLEAIDKDLKTNFADCDPRLVSPEYYNFSTDYLEFKKSKMNRVLQDLVYKDDSQLQALLDDLQYFSELEFDIVKSKTKAKKWLYRIRKKKFKKC